MWLINFIPQGVHVSGCALIINISPFSIPQALSKIKNSAAVALLYFHRYTNRTELPFYSVSSSMPLLCPPLSLLLSNSNPKGTFFSLISFSNNCFHQTTGTIHFPPITITCCMFFPSVSLLCYTSLSLLTLQPSI